MLADKTYAYGACVILPTRIKRIEECGVRLFRSALTGGKRLASSIKLPLLTSLNSRASFREECYCAIAVSLKRFQDFRAKRREFVHTRACGSPSEIQRAMRISQPHASTNSFRVVFPKSQCTDGRILGKNLQQRRLARAPDSRAIIITNIHPAEILTSLLFVPLQKKKRKEKEDRKD